jgi:hypothetical protein
MPTRTEKEKMLAGESYNLSWLDGCKRGVLPSGALLHQSSIVKERNSSTQVN